MYPSDYGFAVGGETRTNCLEKNLNTYNDYCFTNDWIYLNNTSQWLLTPFSNYSYCASSIYKEGNLYNNNICTYAAVRSSIYLKPDVRITGGSGLENDPYTFG